MHLMPHGCTVRFGKRTQSRDGNVSPDLDFWKGLFHTSLFDPNFGKSYTHKIQIVLFTRCKSYKPKLHPSDIYRFNSCLIENTEPTLLPMGVCWLEKLLFMSES